MNLNKEEIVQQIKSGNKLVFEALYRFYYPKIAYFSNQYLLDSIESNSIAQDVFTDLWERRQKLTNHTNIQAWLFTVAKNKSLKRIEKLRSQQNYTGYLKGRQLEINYQSLSGFDTSEFVFEELQYKIEEALQKLSPSVRLVFEKSRFEDKKNREIAEELGISIKTVEAHISKSLKHLRVELKEYLPLLYILFFLK
ncbi:RNA polymerase sigma-70 factor [Sunxiuqinia sp. sy24]|uniref:RNA polymerase sigma-70 factor n=1 Tax=Sunxiuqinia sp. sy24 TaxID=3461495 RepID=UPI004046234E